MASSFSVQFEDMDSMWLTAREKEIADQLSCEQEKNARLMRVINVFEQQEALHKLRLENSKLESKIVVLSSSSSDSDSDKSADDGEGDTRHHKRVSEKSKKKKVKAKSKKADKQGKGVSVQGKQDASESEGSSMQAESHEICKYHFLHCKGIECICAIACVNSCVMSGIFAGNAESNEKQSLVNVTKKLVDNVVDKVRSHPRYFGHSELGDGWKKSRKTEGKVHVAWANKNLGPRYSIIDDDDMSLSELDLRLLMAGELNIISSKHIDETERSARIELLGDIVFNAGHYQWNAVLKFYSAVLSRIANGELKWGDSYHRMEQQLLMPFPRNQFDQRGKTARRVRDPDRPIYCREFQSQECEHTGDHMGKFYGEQVTFRHICMKCLQEDGKVVEHPASAQNCPHY